MCLIDVNELKRKIAEMQEVYNDPYEHYDNGFQDAVSQIDDLVDSLSTIDTVKHGTWQIHLMESEGHIFGKSMLCSKCGFFWREALHNKVFKYCPNCGAKMDGE